MSEISLLAFEAFIQKELTLIQTQRITPIDPDQPILKRKSQALLLIIPLIPLLAQLATDYNQYISEYNELIDQLESQNALISNVIKYHFNMAKQIHSTLIKEEGLCCAQLETLFRWWVQTPYAKQRTYRQTEITLFKQCHQFTKHAAKLREVNRDINHYERHIKTTKLQLISGTGYKHNPSIFSYQQQLRHLKSEEDFIISTLKTLASEILHASDTLRAQTPNTPPIYLETIGDINIDWAQNCTIRHP